MIFGHSHTLTRLTDQHAGLLRGSSSKLSAFQTLRIINKPNRTGNTNGVVGYIIGKRQLTDTRPNNFGKLKTCSGLGIRHQDGKFVVGKAGNSCIFRADQIKQTTNFRKNVISLEIPIMLVDPLKTIKIKKQNPQCAGKGDVHFCCFHVRRATAGLYASLYLINGFLQFIHKIITRKQSGQRIGDTFFIQGDLFQDGTGKGHDIFGGCPRSLELHSLSYKIAEHPPLKNKRKNQFPVRHPELGFRNRRARMISWKKQAVGGERQEFSYTIFDRMLEINQLLRSERKGTVRKDVFYRPHNAGEYIGVEFNSNKSSDFRHKYVFP
ncbi:protein of unknown function [Pseudodesulfovibrio piezophilus C1TLV30]|uniref:Uncharacterized protein n=1 Tax=Pseudodesulfovibrio piezophilus (strain DSM 21447 / JCM 15486 / C1TLV30) TaxID=1322246 RepID=M1WS12_PSEP2|nr:protein of unknown function [Pseudodesulfovibrio piezophilus C1TLV30]